MPFRSLAEVPASGAHQFYRCSADGRRGCFLVGAVEPLRKGRPGIDSQLIVVELFGGFTTLYLCFAGF